MMAYHQGIGKAQHNDTQLADDNGKPQEKEGPVVPPVGLQQMFHWSFRL